MPPSVPPAGCGVDEALWRRAGQLVVRIMLAPDHAPQRSGPCLALRTLTPPPPPNPDNCWAFRIAHHWALQSSAVNHFLTVMAVVGQVYGEATLVVETTLILTTSVSLCQWTR